MGSGGGLWLGRSCGAKGGGGGAEDGGVEDSLKSGCAVWPGEGGAVYEERGRALGKDAVLSKGLRDGDRSGALPLNPSPCDGGFQRGCFRLAEEPERDTETQTTFLHK